ncbi:hypothetical protein JCM5350_005894 [Sporobolomyces pararoseus]
MPSSIDPRPSTPEPAVEDQTTILRHEQIARILQTCIPAIENIWLSRRHAFPQNASMIDFYERSAIQACLDRGYPRGEVIPIWNQLLEERLHLPPSTLWRARIIPLSHQLMEESARQEGEQRGRGPEGGNQSRGDDYGDFISRAPTPPPRYSSPPSSYQVVSRSNGSPSLPSRMSTLDLQILRTRAFEARRQRQLEAREAKYRNWSGGNEGGK